MTGEPAAVSVPPHSLARRLARRTIDLLVMGWFLAVAVTTGRQFHHWWHGDESPVVDLTTDPGFEWSSRPLDVTVGTGGVSLHREPFQGTRSEVLQRLSNLALRHDTATSELSEAERALIAALQSTTPLMSTESRDVYELTTPMPAVVVLALQSTPVRITAQAFAVPHGGDHWTVFVLPNGAPSAGRRWPPSATVLLSWSDSAGNAVAALQGAGAMTATVASFDKCFGVDNAILRRLHSDAASLRYRTAKELVDVQLQATQNGWTGVAWVSVK